LSGVRTTALVSSSTLALGSVTGVLLARGLGPTARGELVAASVGPQVIAVVMTLGIDEALVYLLARARSEHDVSQIYGSALVVSGAVGLLATGLAELLQWLYFAPAAAGHTLRLCILPNGKHLVSSHARRHAGTPAVWAMERMSPINSCHVSGTRGRSCSSTEAFG
jgi:O-antigen/teichoic acid export membrane protein